MISCATAEYTGGGIYIYYGQLKDGNYFRGCDDWDSIEICSKDTGTEEAEHIDFYDAYSIKSLTGQEYKTFFHKMLLWILKNKPKGNYCGEELERRLQKED